MWRYVQTNELYHHGIKGMKWGVRRSKEELNKDPEHRKIAYKRLINGFFYAPNKIKVTGVNGHLFDDRREDRDYTPKDVINSIKHPLKIEDKIRYNERGQPSIRYIGEKVTSNVNPITGEIVTAWRTHTKLLKKLERGK